MTDLRLLKWIRVEDKLPEKSQHVLVRANDIVTSFTDLVYCYICPEYDNAFWQKDDEDYPPIVTHWMPLPDPPEAAQ